MYDVNKSSVKDSFEEISRNNLLVIQGGEDAHNALLETIKNYLVKLFGITENDN